MKSFPYIVIGLGLTGQSVARYLQQKNLAFAVCDTRDEPPNLTEFKRQFPDVPVYCGALNADLLSRASQLIVSPGVGLATPEIQLAINAGVEVVGDVELFLREVDAPVIAITGSNGKTTVTTLVNAMAQASGIKSSVGGNIGTPVLDLLVEPYELFVLELSSFQLETTDSLHAMAAVVLNVSDNHMDRYNCFDDYVAAKNRIYDSAKVAIINLDNSPAWAQASLGKVQVGFTVEGTTGENCSKIFTLQNQMLCCNDEAWISVSDVSIRTKHHLANLLAAFALGDSCGFKKEAMLSVARTFVGVPHRCQIILEKNDIVWVNDSKATTVAATTAALNSFGPMMSGNVILIAGGDGKDADFAPLTSLFEQYCRTVILLGRDAKKIAAIVPDTVESIVVNSLVEAVDAAKIKTQAGDVVLLSPACASTDMFKNYAVRGDEFAALAKKVNDV